MGPAARIASNALLTIAKRPEAGQTKTRLTPPLTPEAAAELYECLLADTLDVARRVPGVDRGILYLPKGSEPYFATLAPDFALTLQQGASLGERLDNALTALLGCGYSRVVIMNSDGPSLPAEHVAAAFDALARGAEVVFGPSDDGGYYLVGASRPVPRLLRDVKMSTPTVLADTLALAGAEGLRVALLPAWYDVDELADLRRLARDLANAPPTVAARTRGYLKSLEPAPEGSPR
ncbi:MAG: TIGR04282 family arsenosugar biosynthesis glycosyltransferase [Anaerolineae bacterium]|jgi:rSAM/selenodomain-associated transferase 1|nr:TIGR04282 family arsenosugar biosynthesis glycosyltransferase [Anaerolineae bacterium]